MDPAGPERSPPAEPRAPGGRLIGKRSAPEAAPARPPSSGELSPSIAWVAGDPARAGQADWETPHLGADGRLEHRLPAKVGPYAVLGEIARGGMGIVVRAQHEALGRPVALKLLRTVGADEEARARFLLEARTAARLRHPGIVQVHDVVTDPQGRAYLVMDLVEGRSLRAIIDERGRLPGPEAALLVAQVSEAVEHAHGQGVIHRDLKPHNVLIDARTRQPLLTDFGLAKVVAGPEASSDSSTRSHPRPGDAAKATPAPPPGLTRSDVVLGTPRYMAPEQVDPSRGRIGPPTDVYGLGGILYECLTGVTPFEGTETNETFLRVLDEAPPALPADVPRGLEAIALRCLEKSPHARYRTAGDLRRELERFLAGRRTLGEVHVSPRPPGASLGRFALAVGLCGVAGWLVVTRAWPAAREALAAASTAAASSRAGGPAPTEAPPPPAPPRPLGLPTAGAPGVELRPGLRLAPTPLTTENVERLAGEGYADALLVWGHGRLTGTLGGPADAALGRRLIERAAEAGLPQALLFLGQALQGHGDAGLPPDPPAARRWLERGAAAGSVECMAALGALLASSGAPEDERPALRWLEQAAAAKLPQARALLADLLASERSVRDPARAVALWREDAAAGSAQAMLRLGQAYEVGLHGLRRDPAEARAWYEKARAAGSEEAGRRLLGLGR